MKPLKVKKRRTPAGVSQPAVYFDHEYRYRSVTGVLVSLAFPGFFATVTLVVCGLVIWLTLSYFLLGVGIIIGDFDERALNKVAPSLLVAIPLGLVFGWFSYHMLSIPRNILRNASFTARITDLGVQIANNLYSWEDISSIGFTHVVPFARGFLRFRFGMRTIWIPTRTWIPWREYCELKERLSQSVRIRYPNVLFSHSSPVGQFWIADEFALDHKEV